MVFPEAKQAVKKKPEICSFCDGALRERKVQKPCWWGKNLKVIVEGVPVLACSRCGELYYPAAVLKQVARLTRKLPRASGKRIAVIRFPE